ncbi:MAG: ATP-binding protein, partial [Gemmatimonadota bacterium]
MPRIGEIVRMGTGQRDNSDGAIAPMPTDDKPLEASQFEKLGSFYLGREVDPADPEASGPLLMYDARDLTTHAVAVGMTGSGKTGLCLSLLEEAAIDGIPAIAIDPKGDLGNLLLTFPDLAPGDFRPWIDEAKAARKGVTPDELAEDEAAKWKKGLASWGQDGQRIARLREAVDLAVYTPGASHGLPLAVLRSLSAPPVGAGADPDARRERVASTVSALLALAGEEVDPLQSREHILLSHIVERAWGDGIDLDLEAVIRAVQSPGFDRVGVLDLDSFYPEKDRFALAMKLNNLLAAPGFEAWLEGDPLDIKSLLWTRDGKPRISIISIAHLGDAERMFLVTLVLNELLAWIRTRPGTASLRAILYMDEVFGYLPPSRIPPSKPPLLTLLKQARAYGLGVVLATQNPVDLDYKALSNAGTWFLGRLQTERDKNRVMDGLDGAAAFNEAGLDRREMDRILGGLQSRTFLLNNVHEDGPVLFRTRWAMSYLRGPMARPEIRRLMEPRREAAARALSAAPQRGERVEAGPPRSAGQPESARSDIERPVVPPGVEETFIRSGPGMAGAAYRPALLAEVDLHYARATLGLDLWERVVCVAPLPADVPPNPWEAAETFATLDVSADPEPGVVFGKLPSAAARVASYRSWKSALKGHLYQNRPLELLRCATLKLVSDAGESEADFRIRVREAAREARDEEIDELRDRFATRLARIDERIRKAEERVEREESQYSQQKVQAAISVGATVLDAFLGRKKLSRRSMGRATSAMRGAGRASRERDDIRRAEESVDSLRAQRVEM